MSNDPTRGCAYTSVFSPGYVHEKRHRDDSTVVNSFICNHAMDVY